METKTMSKDFHRVVMVKGSPEKAMAAINDVSGWWAKNVKGSSSALHDKFRVIFGKTWVDFEISEMIPAKKVVWTVLDCNLEWIEDKKEWKGNKVVFELAASGDSTRIDFTHIGLVPGAECYESCEVGWTKHLKKGLEQLVNTGKGEPE